MSQQPLTGAQAAKNSYSTFPSDTAPSPPTPVDTATTARHTGEEPTGVDDDGDRRGLLARLWFRISFRITTTVISINSFFTPEYYISTARTPEPSCHPRSILARPIFLSYRKPETGLYYKGRDDVLVVLFWILLLFEAKAGAFRWVWIPLARRLDLSEGDDTDRFLLRFAEQTHGCLCAICTFCISFYLMQRSSYRNFKTKSFWTDYPHELMRGLEKLFYLTQIAFSIQRTFSFFQEVKRDGEWFTLLLVHLITVLLLSSSYAFNWTPMGIAILCTMSISEIILPVPFHLLFL
ncbi:LAG1-domain-containing protein [Meredithblackwellia eburnea MCA 4105]